MKYKKTIIIIAIIIWCGIIFSFSNKNSTDSNNTSKEVITTSLKNIVTVTNKLRITHINLTTNWLNATTNKLNYPVRKFAHATIYFILGILAFFLFCTIGLKDYQILLLSILFCFGYSLTDEYHQTFVSNRTGQLSDCLIDTAGASASSSILYILLKNKQRKTVKNK